MDKKQNEVAEKAYELWQARGCPHGSPEEDWYESERLLSSASPKTGAEDSAVDEANAASFPASDPPATHIPDAPPDNAADKWNAVGINRKR